MRRTTLRLLSTLAVLATSLVMTVSGALPAAAAPGDPFDPADSIVFVAQNTPTQLFRAIPDGSGTVVFQPEGPPSPINYNAVAYNPADDYVWGIKTSSPTAAAGPASWPLGAIIRVGEGGVVTRVGTASTGVTNIVGAFGGDGFFYVGSSSSTSMERIHPVTGAITRSYTLPSTTGAPDLAYANGYFWGVDTAGQIVRVLLGPTTQVSTFASPIPAGTYGAAWTYGNGNLGFSENGTGQVTQLAVTNPGSPAPTFSIVSTQPGPASGNNDGAASPGLPTDLRITKTGTDPLVAGAPVTYTLTVTNDGPGNATGFVVTDTLPAELINVASPTPGCNVAGRTVTCTSGRLEVGDSRAVTITADVPGGQYACLTNSATVLPNEEDTDPTNNTDSVRSCPAAGLSLAKSSSTTDISFAGQVVDYDLVVTNVGPVTVDGISISDPLADPVTCPLASLGSGQSMTCTAEYVVTQADLDGGGPVSNIATVDGNGPGGPVPTEESPPVEIDVTQSPGIELTKSSDPVDTLPAVGETITYTFVATNTGNVTLTDVSISDPMPGVSGLACDAAQPATLAPASQLICTATYTVTQEDVDLGSVGNLATATGTPPDGPPVESQDGTEVPADQIPGIQVTKRADRAEVDAAGEVITYTVVAANTGNVTLSDVAVSDSMAGLSPFTCDLPVPAVLVPGEQLVCTATYEVTQDDLDVGGTISNVASASGTSPDDTPVTGGSPTVDVPIAQEPDLNLQKAADTGEVTAAGEVITYTFVATNIGNVTLSDVGVADPLPGLSPLDCGLAVPATLAPGDALTCTATYEVTQDDIDAGGVSNVASATGSPPDGPAVTGESPRVEVVASLEPSLNIVKSSTDTVFGVGDVLSYQFLVTNAGNVTIVGLVVQDPLLDAPPACPVTVLAPGESTTCTGSRTTTQADVDAAEFTNTANALGQPPTGLPVTSPPSSVTIDAEPAAPGLTVDKQADRSTFTQVGEAIGFSFLVTNTGNVTLSAITVDDDLLDEPAVCPVTSLAPGESTICTGSRAITAAEVAAGELVNTTTVTGITPSGATIVSGADTVRIAYDPPPAPPGSGGTLPRTGADASTLVNLAFAMLAIGRLLRGSRARLPG